MPCSLPNEETISKEVILDFNRNSSARNGLPFVAYSVDWAAIRILGPPDVYPNYGDIEGAWTQQSERAPIEYIQVMKL